jgi:hypothetical protein
MTRPTDIPTIPQRSVAGELSPEQERTIARFEQPHTVRRSYIKGVATVYVYHQMSVVRYLVDDDGTVLSSEQFRASPCDCDIRRKLLAQRFGEGPEESQHGDH